ncbi:putative RNA polymerase II subunit B1 CTD phosphatase RPAP2 homolog isoform X2 [Henckelia pumila]|uniref:putative RNA polymerase II subunit B1 CTD phosphatase RPAP2 homolog isoform X2 n=1 Tax=Henckelia pumila TaxID=405737 RepID=UPI003C6DBEA5
MAKDGALTVKDAVHKLQLFLLEGISHENQLLAAGSVISQSDYRDVVTERTIVNMCGYPLCTKSLPNERPWKGNYHISLKEHKVYDLQETYMYCSNGCLINSRAFVGSLEEERCSILSSAQINEVLKLFEVLSSNAAIDMGKNGELGLTELKILEKKDAESGEVSLEEWIGPANAIEGYVPLRDQSLKQPQPNNLNGVKHEQLDDADIISNYVNFTSTIIMQDEYCTPKTGPPVKAEKPKGKVGRREVNYQGGPTQMPNTPSGNFGEARSKMLHKEKNAATTDNQLKVSKNCPGPSQNNQNRNATKAGSNLGKESKGGTAVLKSSLKTSDSAKATRSVTWADEKTDANGLSNQECIEFKHSKGAVAEPFSLGKEVNEDSYRFASAEACARGLSEAAEAVASGKSDSSVAFSEADLMIMPPHGMTEAKSFENGDVIDTDISILKWPARRGISNDDPFDSENSLYDSPPEGFSLALSPFSTMFMALFAWISSSSLAYIYGRDGSYHEDFLSVNGKEYPRKIFIPDGRSSEIKLTMAGCLSRALPGLVTVLRLPTPVSTLEQGMGHLLDTMSFLDPLPPFRMKQWQVIMFLFLDALSVSRIPALTPYMMDRRILLPKSSQIPNTSRQSLSLAAACRSLAPLAARRRLLLHSSFCLFVMESFQNESGQEDVDDYSPLWRFVTKVEKGTAGGNVTWIF